MPNAESARPGLPRVIVLMGVMNGARFLAEQLDSIAAQSGVAVSILVSDDGSTDGSQALVADWSRRNPSVPVTWTAGPGQGFAENFRALILGAPEAADFYAFADQDDVWLADKLATAIAALADGAGPAVYGGRTRLIGEGGETLGTSPLFARPPGFANALVQSIFGGNTIVLNAAGFQLLRRASVRTGFVSHDWWAYMVIAGAGGRVIYDPDPRVLYRQHAANLVGANTGWRARMNRLRRLLSGQFRRWSAVNLAALDAISDLLTPTARTQLEGFRTLHCGPVCRRLLALRRTGFYRQGRAGTLSLFAAAVLGRI